jgi:hypothetical protein
MTANPASQGGNEDLPGLEDGGHPWIVACREGIRQLSSAVRVGLFFPGFCSAVNLDTTPSSKPCSAGCDTDATLSAWMAPRSASRRAERPRD